MKKQQFQYGLEGYRWSPESFKIRKGLVGQPKKELPFTREERREVGYCFITKGFWAAVGLIKRIERKRTHERRSYMTYGFWSKEQPGRYVYCPLLQCGTDAGIAERLYIFKELRRHLAETGGRVVLSAQCELDGQCKSIHVKENVITADFSRPLRIWLEAA